MRLPLNLCLNPEARNQQTSLPSLLASLPRSLSHPCSKRSLVMPVLRTPWRAGSENREIPVKNKSSYNFLCFAGLFLRLVQLLIQHSWGSQAEGTKQWEVMAVAMLLRERSTKSHLLLAPRGWRRFSISHGRKRRRHTDVGQLPSNSSEQLTLPLLPEDFIPSLVKGGSVGSVTPCSLGTQLHTLFA